MNPNTGHIDRFESTQEARARGYTVPLDTPRTSPESFVVHPAMQAPASSLARAATAAAVSLSPFGVGSKQLGSRTRFKQRPRVSR